MQLKAYQLIEQGWCRHSFAYTWYGKSVEWSHQDAAAWCITGALLRVYVGELGCGGARAFKLVEAYLEKFHKHRGFLSDWNDQQSSSVPVVRLLKHLNL